MDIAALQGITTVEADMLRHGGVTTVDDLWIAIARDDNFSGGIDVLAEQFGVPRDRLVELLTLQALREARTSRESWRERHWRKLLLLVFLPLLLWGCLVA